MPWQPADAARHVKGLTAHQQTVWANVANDALQRCLKDGGTASTCDARAIRQANAVAQRAPQRAGEPRHLAEWSTAMVNDFPDSSFAWIAPGGTKDATGKTTPRALRHLVYRDADGKIDAAHTRNALARLNQVQGLSGAAADRVRAKLQAALRSVGGQPAAAAEPDASAVHGDSAGLSTRYLRRLRDLVRGHLQKMGTMTVAQFDEFMRSARGHAGGHASAAARAAFDPYDLPQMAPMPTLPMPEGEDMDDEDEDFQYPKADPRINYRAATQVGTTCDDCVNFCAWDNSCEIVEGRIDPNGVCDMFASDALEDAGEPDDGAAAHEVADLCALHEVADRCARDAGTAPRPGWRLFVDVGRRFAVPPTTMPLLPRPGRYQHPRYGEIVITPERNQHFIDQFAAGVYQNPLPINAEHEPDREGAYGWITGLHLTDDGAVDATVEWTDRGRAAIEANRFRFVSAEWHDAWQAPTGEVYTDVLLGAALCVRPYFKAPHLRPLVASERGLEVPDGALSGPYSAASDTVIFFSALPPVTSDAGTTPQEVGMGEPTVPALTADEARVMTERLTALEAERDALKTAAEQNAAAAKQAAERVAALEGAAQHKRFTDEVMGRSDANHLRWYGEPDKHIALLQRLATAFGEDAEEVRQYIEQNRAHAAQLQQLVGPEIGRDGSGADLTSPQGQLEAKVAALTEKGGLSTAQAWDQVIQQEPALYAEYAAARRGGR